MSGARADRSGLKNRKERASGAERMIAPFVSFTGALLYAILAVPLNTFVR